MTQEKLEKLFELAEELYVEEQKKSGMLTPMEYAIALNNNTGEALVFSAWRIHSEELIKKVGSYTKFKNRE